MKKIGILTFWEFPEGMAPTTRILAYSKGLVSNGVEVEIYSFRRIFFSQLSKEKIQKSGVVNGAKYTYIHFFNNIGKVFKPIRVFDELILRLKLIIKVLKSHRIQKFDAFLFSFDDLYSLPVYTKLFSLFKIPLIFIADEYPIPIRDFMKDSVPEKMLIKYRKYHTRFKGRILMSEALRSFYNNEVSIKPTFILNTIIDAERFLLRSEPDILCKPYICYMGNFALNKDNVDNIIRAFYIISPNFSNLELHLFGEPNNVDKKIIEKLIKELGIESRVFLKGKLGYDFVPKVLMGAKVLVNSQPITKRAQGGFPTKLGEYLLSGTPSLFTDSGDIAQYVTNNENVFIVHPSWPELYAEKLSWILNNYDQAILVAKNGKNLILNNFNAKIQTKYMLEFIDSLK